MTQLFRRTEIERALKDIDPIQTIEEGFIAYSRGLVVVPPVGELIFKDPPGDVHIKYGYIKNDDYYVIKIASGFYAENMQNLTQSGLMLIFKQKDGALEAVLLDEGHLTNIRTAAAGAVVAKYLAPRLISGIGIIGAGVQAKMQLEYLQSIITCKDVFVWGLNQKELDVYKKEMEGFGFIIKTSLRVNDIVGNSNLIITATPSHSPLVAAKSVQKGTHITAIGSDTPEKQELDTRILEMADIVVADSISQCLVRGEISKAIKAGVLKKDKIRELGHIITDKTQQRTSDDQITVADLTGVAVQDIQISKAVYNRLMQQV